MFIRTKETCQYLNMSKSGLKSLQEKCPDFPKPIKFGKSKQSPVYFKKEELEKWVANLNSDTFKMENENESK